MFNYFHRSTTILVCFLLMAQGCMTTTDSSNQASPQPAKAPDVSGQPTPQSSISTEQSIVDLDWDQYLIYNPAMPATNQAPNTQTPVVNEAKVPAAAVIPAEPIKVEEPSSPVQPQQPIAAETTAPTIIHEEQPTPLGVPPTAIVRVPGKPANNQGSQEARAADYLKNQEHQGGKLTTADIDVGSRTPDVRSMPVGLEASPDLVDEKGTYRVNIPQLNARLGPSMQSAVVRTLDKGQIVRGLGREGIWVHTAENDYVSIIFLTKVSPN